LWGFNDRGQLGQFNTINRSTPTVFGTPQNYFWKKIACGYTHTIALNSNGTLWSWGLNTYGQLGLSDLTNRISPVQIGTLSNWNQIACGQFYTAAINSLGQLYTWGANEFGQQGNFASLTYPVQRSTTDRNYTGVVTNKDNTLFTKNDSTTWSVGNNSFGALGLNNTAAQILPIQIGTINNVSKIDTKNYSSIIFTK
jgi:alpha-tubulin suppressor-like RCC1 family protein